LVLKSLGEKLEQSGEKSVGPDRVYREILNLGGEAMIPYLARILDTTMNNDTLPGDWNRDIVVPIHKGLLDH
jgi:hypothetical protein